MNKRAGIMLARKFEPRLVEKWPYFIHQPKIDGLRCLCKFNQKEGPRFFTSQGNELLTIPTLRGSITAWFSPWPTINEITLDGELTSPNGFQETCRVVKRNSAIVDEITLLYQVFDIKNEEKQVRRSERLIDLFCLPHASNLILVPTVVEAGVLTAAKAFYYVSMYEDKGYEGAIFRNPDGHYEEKKSANLLKLKFYLTGEFEIIGATEEISITGEPKGTLGALTCITRTNGVFSVGSGLTAGQRIELWLQRDELIGKQVQIKFQALTEGRSVPRFPTFIQLI